MCIQHFIIFVAHNAEKLQPENGIMSIAFLRRGLPGCPTPFEIFQTENLAAAAEARTSAVTQARAALGGLGSGEAGNLRAVNVLVDCLARERGSSGGGSSSGSGTGAVWGWAGSGSAERVRSGAAWSSLSAVPGMLVAKASPATRQLVQVCDGQQTKLGKVC